MTTKHTAGPWKWEYDDADSMATALVTDDDREIILIADVECSPKNGALYTRINTISGEADARLIAAAPELYAIVRGLLDQAKPDTKLPAWIWKKGRAVLAKVEGETE